MHTLAKKSNDSIIFNPNYVISFSFIVIVFVLIFSYIIIIIIIKSRKENHDF